MIPVAAESHKSSSIGLNSNGAGRKSQSAGIAVARSKDQRGGTGETSASDYPIESLIHDFQPITLEATNQAARMLKRQENKYVLDIGGLKTFLVDLRDTFAILEIGGKKVFGYSSCYFDDQLKSYYDHLQGKRLRFKIRTRCYVDTGTTFFEVKLKDKRGATNKKRISVAEFAPLTLNEENKNMLYEFYLKLYNKNFSFNLRPSILVNFKRITLVSLVGGERTTIDYGLSFKPIGGSPIQLSDDFIIVETKSSKGKGVADGVLKQQGIRSIKYCSKYCIGAILSGSVERYNVFRPVIRLVNKRVVNGPSPGNATGAAVDPRTDGGSILVTGRNRK